MAINHNPVWIPRTAALVNGTVDHYVAVNVGGVGFYYEVFSLESEVIVAAITMDLIPWTYQRPVSGSYSNQPPSAYSATLPSSELDEDGKWIEQTAGRPKEDFATKILEELDIWLQYKIIKFNKYFFKRY